MRRRMWVFSIVPIQVKAIAAATSLPGVPRAWQVTIRLASGPSPIRYHIPAIAFLRKFNTGVEKFQSVTEIYAVLNSHILRVGEVGRYERACCDIVREASDFLPTRRKVGNFLSMAAVMAWVTRMVVAPVMGFVGIFVGTYERHHGEQHYEVKECG
jgi:hypothetical protein